MYTIKAFPQDGGEYWIHNPKQEVLIAGDPYYDIGDNENGYAEFTIYPDHPYYNKVKKLTTDITFYKDGVEVFSGRVLYDDEDVNGTKQVYVEGELGFLCDSIQRPAEYHNISPKDLLTTVIDIHNNQVEDRKKFEVGRVSVEDSNDSLYRYSNYETTREWIQDRLVDRLGGHLVIRKEDGIRYLDWLSDEEYYINSEQPIEFGENLLDYAKNADATELATCIIPLGVQLDESPIEALEARLTIEDVNGGVDYVTDDAAVAEYGRIFKVETWDDVTVATNLKTKAEEYLKTKQYENIVLELTAIDMSMSDEEVEEITLRNRVRCIFPANGVDAWYPISEMRIYLMSFGNNKFTLGTETKSLSYVASSQQKSAEITRTIQNIPTKSEMLKEALAEATDLINSMVASGHAIHLPEEFIVADDEDYLGQAQNLWRWGLGGLAHYSNGYYEEADGIALTMDGKINGKMLMANSVYAESIDIGYTESMEAKIDEAETSANGYTDQQTKYVEETVTNSITNLDNRIALTVVSTKEAILKKNYVTAGETETLDLDEWSVSVSKAEVEVVEKDNVNCLKLTFTGTGNVTIQQSLGTLPAGTYTVQCETEYDSSEKAPNYIKVGFSNSSETVYYSGFDGDVFNTVKRTMEISESSRTAYFYVYGYSGTVVYIKNLRCLRDYQELLDDVSASLTVAINEVSASVSEIYENSQYDYTQDENFSSNSLPDGWNEGNTSYGTFTYGNDDTLGYCAKITRTSSSGQPYIRFNLGKLPSGTYKLRFKAACGSGQESTARLRYGVSSYTTTSAGTLKSDEWTEFEKDYSSLSTTSTLYLYFYNYVNNTDILITDVEFIGWYSSYNSTQLTLLSDSITSEVTRATAAETKYGTCSTAASTKAKVVECSDFTSNSLKEGATICVYFTYANTASAPTLNVNGTGAKSIYAYGSTIASGSSYNWPEKASVTFVYSGSYWYMADAGSMSKIKQMADSITLSVSSSSGTASIQLSVDGSKQGTTASVVTEARTAFQNESTNCTISAGVITFNSGKIVINGSNFSLDSSGNAKFGGTLNSPSGTIGGWTIASSALYNGTSSISSTTVGTYVGTDGFRNVYKASGGNQAVTITQGYFENKNWAYNWVCNINGQVMLTEGSSYEILATPQYLWMIKGSSGAWLSASNVDKEFWVRNSSNREFSITGAYLTGYDNYVYSSDYWFRVQNNNQRIYANGSWLSGSDKKLKNDIEPLDAEGDKYDQFFDLLEPKTYQLVNRGDEYHTGFVYQDVVNELEEAGIRPEDSALVEEVVTNDETGEVTGAIAYNEIIAILVHEVQNMKKEISKMKQAGQ